MAGTAAAHACPVDGCGRGVAAHEHVWRARRRWRRRRCRRVVVCGAAAAGHCGLRGVCVGLEAAVGGMAFCAFYGFDNCHERSIVLPLQARHTFLGPLHLLASHTSPLRIPKAHTHTHTFPTSLAVHPRALVAQQHRRRRRRQRRRRARQRRRRPRRIASPHSRRRSRRRARRRWRFRRCPPVVKERAPAAHCVPHGRHRWRRRQ